MHKKIGNQDALKRAFESVKQYKEIQPDEFTRSDFMEFSAKSGVKINTKMATTRLRALVDAGQLEARETTVNGIRMNVYREKQ